MSPPDALPRTQPLPPELAGPLAQAAVRLGPFGRQVQWYPELSSTNDLAAALAERGTREGCVVIADAQTAGRGRRGRDWSSPAGAGLYVSVVFRPPSRVVQLLTLAAGVALADGIRTATGLSAVVKWPNDVLIGDRKVAGILAEAGSSEAGAAHVVLGFGLNVHHSAYAPDVARRATSLEDELGRGIDRGLVLAECLASLAARYEDLLRDRTGSILVAWRGYAAPLLGRPVEWEARDGVHRGVAEDIDASGALVVRTRSGVERVLGGEVRWV